MFKLAKNAVSKSPMKLQVCIEKILEFFLYYRIFGLRTAILLVLLPDYCPVEKQKDKKRLDLAHWP